MADVAVPSPIAAEQSCSADEQSCDQTSKGEALAQEALDPETLDTEEQDEAARKPKKHECSCSKCLQIVEKAEAQMVGSSKVNSLWTCNKCNSLAGRIRRMQKARGGVLSEFSLIKDKEELAKFYSAYQEAQGDKLADGLEAFVQFIKTKTSSVFTGSRGEGRPISWYLAQGYSKSHVEHMAKSVKGVWDPKINDWTYALDILNHGQEDTETNERQTVYKPKDTKKRPRRNAAAGTTEGSVPKKGRVNVFRLAKKHAGEIGPIQMMLTNTLNVKLPAVNDKVPGYIVEQCRGLLSSLNTILDSWNQILTGLKTTVDESLTDETNTIMPKAQEAAKSLDTMIQIAMASKP